MLGYLAAWIATAVVFLGLDAIWLSQMGPRLYRPIIGEILAAKVDLGAAVAFYLMYVSGIVFLAVHPALEKGGLGKAVMMGAIIALFAYGTYDLTNQATLKVWDVRLTLLDLCWGAFVTSMAAGAGYLAASRFVGAAPSP
ncbi:MAG: DUF2177 family protein [Hyphomonadaceae bacterium]|nr:DUF2177 family protein [Hyphomonadaceae bacterium]